MPIEHAIWKINNDPKQVDVCNLQNEKRLEEIIFKDPRVLSDQWMLIGRQVQTSFNKYIDLLALDSSGSIVIIELKKDKTPRETVAQTIDYASWVKNLDSTDLANIYEDFCGRYLNPNYA